ncbi:MAG: hypothetical protein EA381_11680 [Planctomycetaceae bacterium]|nr:MAG: hypothetical protein EA381_11680 [Planctomycetaceae bacterium]
MSAVRDALRGWLLTHLPEKPRAADPAGEAMLIQDGCFCGRRFRFPEHAAVWFLEEDEVKLRDLQGKLMICLHGSQVDEWAAVWRSRQASPMEQGAQADREEPSDAPATLPMPATTASAGRPAGAANPDSEDQADSGEGVTPQRRAA